MSTSIYLFAPVHNLTPTVLAVVLELFFKEKIGIFMSASLKFSPG